MRAETSWMTPRPIAAARPLSFTSVSMVPWLWVSSPSRRMATVASAVPCPRVSLAFARMTARCLASSVSTISTSPRYCIVMGPTLTLIPTL